VSGPLARSIPSLLIDTNIILDVILARDPWAADAVRALDAVNRKRARGFISAHAVTTLYYIVEEVRDRTTANTAVADVLQILEVVPLDSSDFQRAIALGLNDFEDAVQVAAHLRAGADFLVTRDAKHFTNAPVTVMSPGEILAILAG
jgi:predicted nucleic acid-binding protein